MAGPNFVETFVATFVGNRSDRDRLACDKGCDGDCDKGTSGIGLARGSSAQEWFY